MMDASGLGSDWTYLSIVPIDNETDEELDIDQTVVTAKCIVKEKPLKEPFNKIEDKLNSMKSDVSNTECAQILAVKDKTGTIHSSDSSFSSDVDVIDESSDSSVTALEASYSSHSSAFSFSGPLTNISDPIIPSASKGLLEDIRSIIEVKPCEETPSAVKYPTKKAESYKKVLRNPTIDHCLNTLFEAPSLKQFAPSLKTKNGKTEKLLRALAKKQPKNCVKRHIATTKFPICTCRRNTVVAFPYHKLKLDFGGTALDLTIVFAVGFLVYLIYSCFVVGELHFGNHRTVELITKDLKLFRDDVLKCLGTQHMKALEDKNEDLLLKNVCIDNPDIWHEKYPHLVNSTSVKFSLLQMLDSAKDSTNGARPTDSSPEITSLSQINLIIRQLDYFKMLVVENKVENEKKKNATELIIEKKTLHGYLLGQLDEFIDILDVADADLKIGLKELNSKMKAGKHFKGYLSLESKIYKVQMENAFLKWQLQDILFQFRSKDFVSLEILPIGKSGKNLFNSIKTEKAIQKIINELKKEVTELKQKNAILEIDKKNTELLLENPQKPMFVTDKNDETSVGTEESSINTNFIAVLQKIDVLQETLLMELSEAFKWNGVFLRFMEELKKSAENNDKCNWSWKDMYEKLTGAVLKSHSDSSAEFSDTKNRKVSGGVHKHIDDSKKPLNDILGSVSRFLKVAQTKGNELVKKTLPDLQADFTMNGVWNVLGGLQKKWADMKLKFLEKESTLDEKSQNDDVLKKNEGDFSFTNDDKTDNSIVPPKINNEETEIAPQMDVKKDSHISLNDKELDDNFLNNNGKDCMCYTTLDHEIQGKDSSFQAEEETLSESQINWFLKRTLYHENIREKAQFDSNSNWYLLRGLHRWRSDVKKGRYKTIQEL